MTIDIISYTDEQFAELTEEQIREIKSVQTKKNRLTVALEEDKRREKFKLVKAGVFRSAIFDKICAELEEAYANEVEDLRDSLLFYLQFSSNKEEIPVAPYEVNYALDYKARAEIVKAYYDGHFDNAVARFEAFKNDKVARVYVGEYYSILYDYYYLQI